MLQFLLGVFLILALGVLSICLMYVFFGTIINMIEDKSLYCYSKGIFKKSKNSRVIGKMILVASSFLMFLVETVATIFGYIVIIGIVVCKILFNKKYGLNDCKRRLFQFTV